MKLLRKITIFALIVLMISSLTGCGAVLGDDEYYSVNFDSEKRGREKAEQLIGYINNKDAAGIKAMFSEKNKKENKELDSKINEFLAAFPDGLKEYEISPLVGGECSTESWSVNYNVESVTIHIPKIGANTSDADKLISIGYTHINHYHEDQVGVNLIRYCDWTDKNNEKEIVIGSRWDSY
jgi:hypothetical protein